MNDDVSYKDVTYGDLKGLESEVLEALMYAARISPDEFNAISTLPDIGYIGDGDGGFNINDEGSFKAAKSAAKEIIAEELKPFYDLDEQKTGDFTKAISELDEAIKIMSGGSEIEEFDMEVTESFALDSAIPAYMSRIKENISGWEGATIRAFRSTYVRRFNPMYGMQCNSLVVLKLSLKAYSKIWPNTRREIAKTMAASRDAFLAYPGGDGYQAMAFNIAAAVAGVIGAMAGPAGALAAAAVGGAISISGSMIKEEEPKRGDIEGNTVHDIWESMRKVIRGLEKEVKRTEESLVKVMEKFYSLYDESFPVDKGAKEGKYIQMTGRELMHLPPPGRIVAESVGATAERSDETPTVDKGKMADEIDPPGEGYDEPNSDETI